MNIQYYKHISSINSEGIEVMIWKFKDESGNIFVTETPIDGTEQEAATIILQSLNA